MRAWVFDRSGLYSLIVFDIYEEPKRFICIIVVYVMMSDEELGFNIFIERDDEY